MPERCGGRSRRSNSDEWARVSEENVELHRRSVEAFNKRGVESFVALCDPQIELHSAVTVPGGAAYHGHDGVRKWHRDLADGWGEELRIEPEAYFDLGEHTITVHVLHGRGRQSGADVAMHAVHVCRWRDGLMTYFRGYSRKEDALGDLGVSEEALAPIAP
jgi:ketosteroid isomerase-like protein